VLLLGAVAFATIVILRIATGRRLVLAGVLAAVGGLVAFVVLMLQAREIPLYWIPVLSIDIGAAPAGVVAAGAAALAVPRWWVRVLGGIVVAGAIAIVAVPAAAEDAAQRAADEANEIASREISVQQQIDAFARPVTTDLDGVTTLWISGGDPVSYATLVSPGGGSFQIQAVADSLYSGGDEHTCWLLHPFPGQGFDETVTMERFDGICERDGDRLELVDGTGFALEFEGHLVLVTTVPDVFFDDLDVDRQATTAELEAAAAELRTISRDEFREVLLRVGTAD